MKRNEFKYPLILASLIASGVGKRKARRMVKRAAFTQHKICGSCVDVAYPLAFCVWADQGSYTKTWMEASKNYEQAQSHSL